jgi:hypothetical protein
VAFHRLIGFYPMNPTKSSTMFVNAIFQWKFSSLIGFQADFSSFQWRNSNAAFLPEPVEDSTK